MKTLYSYLGLPIPTLLRNLVSCPNRIIDASFLKSLANSWSDRIICCNHF
jgi:hypothetical protein